MSRWPPDTPLRLKAAALALFAERGFAEVTVAEIAAGAGMTERTFFRHFKMKEDVLFRDETGMKAALTQAIATAPALATTRDEMLFVARFLAAQFEPRREMHRTLHRVVSSDPTLRARAVLRDHAWGEAAAEGFVRRGYSPAQAAIVAAMTTAAFRTVYLAWASDFDAKTLAQRFVAVTRDLAFLRDGVAQR